MLCSFGFVNDVMFSHNGAYTVKTTKIIFSTYARSRIQHQKYGRKCIGPFYWRAEMCAGRVACCAPLWVTAIMQTGQTDGQTDGRHTVTLRFPLDAASDSLRVF